MPSSVSECEWTRGICNELTRCGAKVFTNQKSYVVGGARGTKLAQPSQSGWPDRWVAHVCWTGWLEFKGLKTKLEPLQAKTIREIEERWPGGAYVCRQHPDGLTLSGWDERPLLVTQGTAEHLLLALLALQMREREWVEDRQRKIASVAGKLADRIRARGEAPEAYVF